MPPTVEIMSGPELAAATGADDATAANGTASTATTSPRDASAPIAAAMLVWSVFTSSWPIAVLSTSTATETFLTTPGAVMMCWTVWETL